MKEAARTGFGIGPDRFSLVTSKGEIRLNDLAEPCGRFSTSSKWQFNSNVQQATAGATGVLDGVRSAASLVARRTPVHGLACKTAVDLKQS